jgi:transposase
MSPFQQPKRGAVRTGVGIDVAKHVHRVTAVDADGVLRIDRKLENTPSAVAELAAELAALRSARCIGLDVVGGLAGLAQAVLAEAGFALVHVSGLAAKCARQGMIGGENKSDPREALAERAPAVAAGRTIGTLGERMTARPIRELATEALVTRARLAELDRELEVLLERRPDATLVRGLPGMWSALTAEVIAEAGGLARFRSADAPASAAGIAPALRQSAKTRSPRRAAAGGNEGLKRVFHRSAFCSPAHPGSRAFHDRKRREGARRHQAVIALARRRVGVLRAVVRSRAPFQAGCKTAARRARHAASRASSSRLRSAPQA